MGTEGANRKGRLPKKRAAMTPGTGHLGRLAKHAKMIQFVHDAWHILSTGKSQC